MASEMHWAGIAFLAVFDDAGVVSWRRDLICSSVAAFCTRAFGAGSAAVLELGFFKLKGLRVRSGL